jgi:hypothetical protein
VALHYVIQAGSGFRLGLGAEFQEAGFAALVGMPNEFLVPAAEFYALT